MRIAINGYGRIGRCILRAICERNDTANIDVVAVNELASADAIAYLTQYDSTHGRFPVEVSLQGEALKLGRRTLRLLREPEASRLTWSECGIDWLLECTGKLKTLEHASAHLTAGARHVLLSNPGESELPVFIYGVNDQQLIEAVKAGDQVLSAGSCTSNALLPVLAVLDNAFGIEQGVITTIHASMHDQPVIDAYHSEDLRKNRAASSSIIPVDTGLAAGVGRILPHLESRLIAHALRVPVNNVSALNVTLNLNNEITVQSANQVLANAANGEMKGVLGYTKELLASCDFNHDPRSAIVDSRQTQVVDSSTLNLLVWFDNEWAFANRMVDLLLAAEQG